MNKIAFSGVMSRKSGSSLPTFQKNVLPPSLGRRVEKRLYISAELHGITHKKTVIFNL
jgi:hypothetical protein